MFTSVNQDSPTPIRQKESFPYTYRPEYLDWRRVSLAEFQCINTYHPPREQR